MVVKLIGSQYSSMGPTPVILDPPPVLETLADLSELASSDEEERSPQSKAHNTEVTRPDSSTSPQNSLSLKKHSKVIIDSLRDAASD
jgi:hypothetical protein